MRTVPWLSILTFFPIAGGIALLLLPKAREHAARAICIAIALVVLGGASALCSGFNAAAGDVQFVERASWVAALGIDYYLGIDGIGLMLVVLSALVVPMGILASPANIHSPRLYFALVLLLQAGLFGTFTALNFFHWFLFWELSLIPAFFLVRLWGGAGRAAAATQFLIYTMVGSVALLLSFAALYLATGKFDLVQLGAMGRAGLLTPALGSTLSWTGLSPASCAGLVFFCGFLGFAVKVPVFPFHSWLPQTYTEAPAGVTMLLSGLMSKMGVYGFLRILLPIFHDQMRVYNNLLLWLAVVSILFSATVAFAQQDLKRMLAYSSMNHLGYCVLGGVSLGTVASLGGGGEPHRVAALSGVLVQIFNHGFTVAALFWMLDMLEHKSAGFRGLNDFGGIRKAAPVLCGFMGIALFSSLGLPGLNGFIGEFLIFRGVFPLAPWAASVSLLGLLLTAVFILTAVQRVFHGPLSPRWRALPDLNWAERLLLAPVIGLMFFLGIYPQALIRWFNATASKMASMF